MNKFSKRFAYYQIFIGFIIALFTGFYFFEIFATTDDSEFLSIQNGLISGVISFLVIQILFITYAFLFNKISYYELTEDKIVCKRGVLFQKKSSILLNKIHTINIKQGIIQKLFKVASLKIDSGSANSLNEEMSIYTSQEEVLDLYNKLKGYDRKSKDNNEDIYTFKNSSKITYSLINTIFSIALLVLIVLYINIVSYFSNNGVFLPFYRVTEITILLLLAFFILNIIAIFTKYYNFNIKKRDNEIEINYGFFVKYHNTFKLDKVKSIIICNNIVQKIFGYVKVKIQVIGYLQDSDNAQSSYGKSVGILIPLCKRRDVKDLINQIIPEYSFSNKEEKPFKFFPFISLRFLFTSIIFAIIEFINLVIKNIFIITDNDFLVSSVGIFIVYVLLLIIILCSAILKYNYSGISLNNDKLTIYKGGFFQAIVVIDVKNIIAIQAITTKSRKKNKICSYVIHYATNALTNTVKVEMLDDEVYTKLVNALKY
ncbi:MAG: PH domain-containing protein [Candidatus Caccosoma sp.]|nr:PH domain-containing protein [Candidatus Caccosoma sp.]